MTMEELDLLRAIRQLALTMIRLEDAIRYATTHEKYRRVGDLVQQRLEVQAQRSELMRDLYLGRRFTMSRYDRKATRAGRL